MPTPSAELHYDVGVALYKEGRLEESITAYSRAISADPTFDKAYNNRGYAEFRRGRHAEALADLDEAVRLNPNDSTALSNRGAVLASLERHDEALADLTRAVKINPGSAQILTDRAGVYLARAETAKAMEDLERALALDANYAAAHYQFGVLYAERGELSKAYPYFERSARLGFAAARNALDLLLKQLFVQANESGSMRQTIELFVDARSEDDFRALADDRPYVLLADFYERFLGQKYEHFPGLRERAMILKEMAKERGLLSRG